MNKKNIISFILIASGMTCILGTISNDIFSTKYTNIKIISSPRRRKNNELEYIQKINSNKAIDHVDTEREKFIKNMNYENTSYKYWNNELNIIWTKLNNNLSQDEINSLTRNEISWIDLKNEYIKKHNINNKKLNGNEELTRLVKDRCYYLVNNYM